MKRYYIDASCECGRFGDEPNLIEDKDGDYCKIEDVEQLQAQTKEFAEFVTMGCEAMVEMFPGLEPKEVYNKAQQYLDNLKEQK